MEHETNPHGAAPEARSGRRLIIAITVTVVVGGVILNRVQNALQNRAAADAGDVASPHVFIPDPNRRAHESQAAANPEKGRVGATVTADPVAPQAEGAPSRGAHPIEPALEKARASLEHIRQTVRDYTATVTKREVEPNGQLGEEQVMFLKVLSRQRDAAGNIVVPMSVYMKMLKPNSVAGREVIWIENRNGNKLVAHDVGLKNILSVWLDPNGLLAMHGQRYPISQIGLENLVLQLIERGERERKHASCDVEFIDGAELNDRVCTVIRVGHPDKKPEYDFHMAEIFIDAQEQIPLRYSAYMWPERTGEEPPIDEQYTYQDVKLNVGLTDADFDPANAEYNFPAPGR